MTYAVQVGHRAERDVMRLPPKQRRQVLDKIVARKDSPRPQDVRALHGEEGGYRVDSGEYRVLYHIDDAARTVSVFRVKHRRDVQRNL